MSASRDEKTGKWTAQCYYENWKGEKKHKKKRGFATKKEALEWEREFLKSTSANMEMMLGAFVDVYFRDKAGELKAVSYTHLDVYKRQFLLFRVLMMMVMKLFVILLMKNHSQLLYLKLWLTHLLVNWHSSVFTPVQ